MFTPHQTQQVLEIIRRLDRPAIVEQLRTCPTRFPLVFTTEWLSAQPIDELRHVFAAVCLQCEIIPQEPAGVGMGSPVGDLAPAVKVTRAPEGNRR